MHAGCKPPDCASRPHARSDILNGPPHPPYTCRLECLLVSRVGHGAARAAGQWCPAWRQRHQLDKVRMLHANCCCAAYCAGSRLTTLKYFRATGKQVWREGGRRNVYACTPPRSPSTLHPPLLAHPPRYPALCGDRCDKTPLQFELTHTYQIQSSCTGPTFSGRVSRPCSAKATPTYCGRTDSCPNTWLAPGYCKDKTMAVSARPQLGQACSRARAGWACTSTCSVLDACRCFQPTCPASAQMVLHNRRSNSAWRASCGRKLRWVWRQACTVWLGSAHWLSGTHAALVSCLRLLSNLTTSTNLRAG